MSDSPSDFSNYSLPQLQELASESNRQHFPNAWQNAQAEIERRSHIPPLSSPDGKLSQPQAHQLPTALRMLIGAALGPVFYTLFVVAIQALFIPGILHQIPYSGIVVLTSLLGIVWGVYLGARLPAIRRSPTLREPKLWKGTLACLAVCALLCVVTGEEDIIFLLPLFGALPLSIVWAEYVVRSSRS